MKPQNIRLRAAAQWNDALGCFVGRAEYSKFYEEEYSSLNPGLHAEDSGEKARVIRDSIEARGSAKTISTILDVGCGSCEAIIRVLGWLKEGGNDRVEAAGLDVSSAILSQGIRMGGLWRVWASAEDIPLEDGSIDLACCMDVVEHVDNPSVALREVARVARVMVLKVPLERSLYTRFRGGKRRLEALRGRFGHIHHFTRGQAVSLVGENFTVLSESYKIIPRRTAPVHILQILLLRLGLKRSFARVFGGFAIFVAQSKVGAQ